MYKTRQIHGDGLNSLVSGCVTGFMIGMSRRSLPAAFGGCAFVGVGTATIELSGPHLGGLTRIPDGLDPNGQFKWHSGMERVQDRRLMWNQTINKAPEAT